MRECLGCETYAKYTHTHVPSCAHFMSASVHHRPSVFFLFFSFVFPVGSVGREQRARGSRLLSTLPARVLYMGPRLPRVLFSSLPGPSAASVVAGGIRDDMSPISPGMSPPLASPRIAGLYARFIVRARRLTASRTVRLLYGLWLRSRENDEIIFARFRLPTVNDRASFAFVELSGSFAQVDEVFD